MHSLSIFIPLALFIVGLIVITYKERSEKAKLSLEDQGRLSIASLKRFCGDFYRLFQSLFVFNYSSFSPTKKTTYSLSH